MPRPTLAEHETRLSVLEANRASDREAVLKAIKHLDQHMREELSALKDRVGKFEESQKEQGEKIAAYENTGKGMLISVGIAAAGAGAGVLALIERAWGVLK